MRDRRDNFTTLLSHRDGDAVLRLLHKPTFIMRMLQSLELYPNIFKPKCEIALQMNLNKCLKVGSGVRNSSFKFGHQLI